MTTLTIEDLSAEAKRRMVEHHIKPRQEREPVPLWCDRDVGMNELHAALSAAGLELVADVRAPWKLVIRRAGL